MTTFCWLPPDSDRASVRRRPAADVELVEQPLGGLEHPAQRQQAPPRARPVVAQREVLGEVEVEHEAPPLAVLRDVPDARPARAARVGAGDRPGRRRGSRPRRRAAGRSRPRRARSARCRRCPRGRRSRRARTCSVDAVDGGQVAVVERRAGRRPRAPTSPGLHSSFSTRRTTSRPTIMRASVGSSAPAVSIVPTLLPRRSTVTRSATFSTSGSLWEMKTIDVPPCLQAARTLMSSRRLLRGEHRRRLVEDEHARAAVQRAEDLDALLLADGDVLDAARPGRPAGRSARRAPGSAAARPRRRGARCGAARRRARGSRRRS